MAGARVSANGPQNYATPLSFIAAVQRKFWISGGFDFDLAADASNSKAREKGCYFSEADDSLQQDWRQLEGNLWLNPPFHNIGPWAEKCARSVDDGPRSGRRIFFLVPASVGSNWFRDHVWGKARVQFLNGRIHFDPQRPSWGYPKDCMLCIFGEPPTMNLWQWKLDIPAGM